MIVDTLTTTIVPVAGAGFSMVHIRGEDEGYDKPTLEEIPISAFRVYDEYGVPIPVVVDDDSTSMPT